MFGLGIGSALSILKIGVGWLQQRSANTKNLVIRQMENRTANRNTDASLQKAAMAHKMFWWAWSLFAIPSGVWFALVMIDSMIAAEYLNLRIPSLPPSILPYFDRIFDNIFLSGATVGGVQVASRGVVAGIAAWTNSRGSNNPQPRSGRRDILK